MSTRPNDRYTIISADCHAGGTHQQYREFLRPSGSDEFDAWRGEYSNPFRDLQDDGRARNWDDERRIADLEADGQVAEVIFPNTVPPFFPTGAVDRPGARRRRGLPAAVGRAAGPQPLARRLVLPVPRAARRYRPDLPRRRRHRDRRGRVDGKTTGCAAVCSFPASPTTRTCRPTTRTTTTGCGRCARSAARVGHTPPAPASRLRQVPELHDPVDDRDGLVRAPAPVAAAHERGVRALPGPQARAHRAGLRLDPAAAMQLDAFHMQMQSGRIGEMNLKNDQPCRSRRPSTSSATCGSA